jgi:hypothetical protein
VQAIKKKQQRTLRLLAYCQAFLLLAIVGSGMLFAHKHQLSSGEVVVHIHPYNLKKDPLGQNHQHSANELHFLDVVFQGTYLGNTILKTDRIWFQQILAKPISRWLPSPHTKSLPPAFFLRGPPHFLVIPS